MPLEEAQELLRPENDSQGGLAAHRIRVAVVAFVILVATLATTQRRNSTTQFSMTSLMSFYPAHTCHADSSRQFGDVEKIQKTCARWGCAHSNFTVINRHPDNKSYINRGGDIPYQISIKQKSHSQIAISQEVQGLCKKSAQTVNRLPTKFDKNDPCFVRLESSTKHEKMLELQEKCAQRGCLMSTSLTALVSLHSTLVLNLRLDVNEPFDGYCDILEFIRMSPEQAAKITQKVTKYMNDQGASSVQAIISHGMLDEFIDMFDLKPIPRQDLKAHLVGMEKEKCRSTFNMVGRTNLNTGTVGGSVVSGDGNAGQDLVSGDGNGNGNGNTVGGSLVSGDGNAGQDLVSGDGNGNGNGNA